MKQLFGIEVTEEEFIKLFEEQSNGKELKVIDGKVVAVEHEETIEEIKQKRINQINIRLAELSQDFIQFQVGAIFEDFEERKKEFQTLHNELRFLLGKSLRQYKNITNETNGDNLVDTNEEIVI